MSAELPSGNIFIGQCPQNSTPTVKLFDLLPPGSKELWVRSIDGNTLEISPLQVGSWNFKIPCTPSGEIAVNFVLVPAEGADKIMPDNPLGLIKPSYPWTLWGLVFLVLVALSVLGAWIYRKWVSPYLEKKKAKSGFVPREPLGSEVLSKALHEFEFFLKSTQPATPSTPKIYTFLQEGLRKALEERFCFSASWATTTEFMGTLKLSVWDIANRDEFLRTCERLLIQNDGIRFSAQNPGRDSQLIYLRELRDIEAKLRVLGKASG